MIELAKSLRPAFSKGGRDGLNSEAGFSLVELMITMVVFVFFIVSASQVFTGLLTQFKQQSKLAETNIEGVVGLEILRQDIEHAGYGLPWYGLVAYSESSTNPYSYNDSPAAPRAILSKNSATFSGPNNIFDGSDYLVIKSVNVSRNDTCNKFTTLSSISPYVRTWTPSGENLGNNDRVIVLRPGSSDADGRTLVVDTSSSTFFTTYTGVTSSTWRPADASETRIVYGVDPDTDLRMPFNRADYVIRRFDSDGKVIAPSHCAPNTGVLEKGVVNQGNGAFSYLPLLDCVADMQVIFGLDTNNNGIIGTYTDGDGTTFIPWPVGTPDESVTSITAFNDAASLRQQVREVRVYILAQDGQRDMNYTYPNSTILVGDSALEASLGNTFNLSSKIGDPEYKYYRWKIYTVVLKPTNLR